MTPDELKELGIELFGAGWQSKLAHSLMRPDGTHVNPRTVRRWVAGDIAVPASVAELLRLKAVAKKLSEHIK